MFLTKRASIILMLGGGSKQMGAVSEIWHGDVDLNFGELEAHYSAYQSHLAISPWRHIQTGLDYVIYIIISLINFYLFVCLF